MKVTIGGEEVFSRKYETFQTLSEEYIDHQSKRGQRVPDYELDGWLMEIANWILSKAADVLVSEGLDRIRGGQEQASSETQEELGERRHKELLDEISRLRKATENVRDDASSENIVQLKDVTQASALLQWLVENDVPITITFETDAENDLREAFEALTEPVRGDTTRGES